MDRSYFRVTGLGVGPSYTVTVSGVSDDVSLLVSYDHFVTTACSSSAAGTADESCVASAAPLPELYIWVSGFSSAAGATFTLNVE